MNHSVQQTLKYIRVVITLTYAAAFFHTVYAATPKQLPTSTQAPILNEQSLADLENRLQQFTKQEVVNKFADSSNDILEKAKRSQESATTLLDVVKWVSSGWLAVVSLVFAALLFIGWREYGLVKKAKEETENAASTVKTAATEATASVDRVRAFDVEIQRSLTDLSPAFATLPDVYHSSLYGETQELPSSENIARLEEADIVLFIAEKTKAIDKARLIEPLIRLGTYWTVVGNYPRAIARCKKAIELDPRSVEARVKLCSALYGPITPEMTPLMKERFLGEAEQECKEILEINEKDSGAFSHLGWIYDERGDYEQAVGFYREAQQSEDEEGIRYRSKTTYNLACSYAKWGKYRETLEELEKIFGKKVIGKNENWEDFAARDPEFDSLKVDVTFGPLFNQLVERTRGQTNNSSATYDPAAT